MSVHESGSVEPIDAEVLEITDSAGMVDGTPPHSPPPPFNSAETTSNEPVPIRGILAVIVLVVLADLTIYRGQGFAGYAAFFVIGPVLLWIGSRQKYTMPAIAIVSMLIVIAAVKLLWSGTILAVVCGFGLLVAFAMSVSGHVPFVGEAIVFATQSVAAGIFALQNYARRLFSSGMPVSRVPWLNVLLPVCALIMFSLIFTFANPDFLKLISVRAEEIILEVRDWLKSFSPGEFVFWIVVAWISLGLMRPFGRSVRETLLPKNFARSTSDEDIRVMIYPATRNTLVTVIALFAAYLFLEFRSLWFREFPDGFYYAGYAHEGAAWLTLALGLATVMLSVFFRGRILKDTRLPRLKTLAWIWSAQNFILAIAVYNRLMIYVNFNGMTRMRIIGFLGITCVVIGFVLVLFKISQRKSFGWLFQRQVLTVALAVFAYAVMPVDSLVQKYNTRQILAGELAPSVQITEHPIDEQGMLAIIPLVDCDDLIIREGVRAMLARHEIEVKDSARVRCGKGWTAFQLLDATSARKLESAGDAWQDYIDDESARTRAIEAFRAYAYQWY